MKIKKTDFSKPVTYGDLCCGDVFFTVDCVDPFICTDLDGYAINLASGESRLFNDYNVAVALCPDAELDLHK